MDLKSLDVEWVANFVVGVIVGLVGVFGYRSGKKGPDNEKQETSGGTTMQIAGALIDSRAAEALKDSFDGLSREVSAVTINMTQNRKLSYEHSERMSRDICKLSDNVERLGETMASIEKEMIRHQRII